jgi:hypothetical protein
MNVGCLRARLFRSGAIRGSPRPATRQRRRVKLSTVRGALQAWRRYMRHQNHPAPKERPKVVTTRSNHPSPAPTHFGFAPPDEKSQNQPSNCASWGCSPGPFLLTSNFEFRLPVDAHKLHAGDSVCLDDPRAPRPPRLTNDPPALRSFISFRPRSFRRGTGDGWFRNTEDERTTEVAELRLPGGEAGCNLAGVRNEFTAEPYCVRRARAALFDAPLRQGPPWKERTGDHHGDGACKKRRTHALPPQMQRESDKLV